jgi:hypothetical protein
MVLSGTRPDAPGCFNLVLGPVPYALAGLTYHRVTEGQQVKARFYEFIPGDQLGGGLKKRDILHFWQWSC